MTYTDQPIYYRLSVEQEVQTITRSMALLNQPFVHEIMNDQKMYLSLLFGLTTDYAPYQAILQKVTINK